VIRARRLPARLKKACFHGARNRGRHLLLGWFSGFPGGGAGFALLVLRAALGVALLIQGTSHLRGPHHIVEAVYALATIAGGVLLIVGFFTAIVAALITLGALGVALSILPLGTRDLFDTRLADAFAMAILLAVLFLGPGAFSVDARVFGRREIIIPPSRK
jgi:uncharacterized membrane protein YphA (DoxX/SURF4 family)